MRHKICFVCRAKFVGKIDKTGTVCSSECAVKLGPEKVSLRKKKKSTMRFITAAEGLSRDGNWKKKHSKKYIKLLEAELQKLRTDTKTAPKDWGFYGTEAWLQLRYKVLKARGRRCEGCLSTTKEIHIDHIKPRSRYPSLELEETNLQVLCKGCNFGKGAWDETDWRLKG